MKTNKLFLRMVVYGIAGLISMTSLGVAREILKKVSERNKSAEDEEFVNEEDV